MSEKILPPIYSKILFWQRFIWLTLVITSLVFLVRLLSSYGNFASNTSDFYIGYAISWGLGAVIWISLMFFIRQLKKSINVGKEYESKRNGREFGKWLIELRKSWNYLTVVMIIMLVRALFNIIVL